MSKELTLEQKNKIKEAIEDVMCVPVDEIKEDSNLHYDIGMDSLDKVELIMKIEKENNVTIPDDEIEHVRTVSDLFKVLAKFI